MKDLISIFKDKVLQAKYLVDDHHTHLFLRHYSGAIVHYHWQYSASRCNTAQLRWLPSTAFHLKNTLYFNESISTKQVVERESLDWYVKPSHGVNCENLLTLQRAFTLGCLPSKGFCRLSTYSIKNKVVHFTDNIVPNDINLGDVLKSWINKEGDAIRRRWKPKGYKLLITRGRK